MDFTNERKLEILNPFLVPYKLSDDYSVKIFYDDY